MPSDRFQYTNLGFEPEIVHLIDDYRFRQRLPTRSQAIRQLIEIALVAQGVVPVEGEGVSVDPPFVGAVPVIQGGKLVGWTGEL